MFGGAPCGILPLNTGQDFNLGIVLVILFCCGCDVREEIF